MSRACFEAWVWKSGYTLREVRPIAFLCWHVDFEIRTCCYWRVRLLLGSIESQVVILAQNRGLLSFDNNRQPSIQARPVLTRRRSIASAHIHLLNVLSYSVSLSHSKKTVSLPPALWRNHHGFQSLMRKHQGLASFLMLSLLRSLSWSTNLV